MTTSGLSAWCKPLRYKWIFKRKLMVDGSIKNTRQDLL